MKTPGIYAVVDAMERQGGSFVRSLAICWRHADPENRETLERAFSILFERYAKVAKEQSRRDG